MEKLVKPVVGACTSPALQQGKLSPVATELLTGRARAGDGAEEHPRCLPVQSP